jgi:bacteriocin-like protein
MSKPHQLDETDLAQVTGGASQVRQDGSSSTDSQMMQMMQQLATAVQAMQKPPDNSSMMAILPMLLDKA